MSTWNYRVMDRSKEIGEPSRPVVEFDNNAG